MSEGRLPRVYVGVPTRNRPTLLLRAVDSLLAQSMQDIRVVVSDNQSEPVAREQARRFVEELGDPRVSYVLQPEDRGEYGQGRFFLADCREEYFAMLHDDDVLAPGYLERAVACLDEHREVDCFFSNAWIFDVEGTELPEHTREYRAQHGRNDMRPGRTEILVPLLSCGAIPISGTFFRTEALHRSGFVDDDCFGSYPFEFNLLLRLGEHGSPAWFESDSLIGFCYQEQSLRNTLKLSVNEHVISTTIRLLERRRFSGEAERLRRKTLGYNYRNYAALRMAAGQTDEGREYLRRALRSYPTSVRSWAWAACEYTIPFVFRPWMRSRVSSA